MAFNNGSAAQIIVTNTDQLAINANPLRKYLLIQNNDATNAIYVQFNAAADATNGIKIPAGVTWEIHKSCHRGDVHLIGAAASNPNVVVMEGVN